MRGKRKFVMALLWWAGSTAGLLLKLIGPGEYVALCGLNLGLYGAANVGSAFVANGK